MLVAGKGGGEGEERAVQVSVAFVAGGQAAVSGKPGDAAFGLLAVPAESFG